MPEKVRVILVTDGDKVAQNVVEDLAASLGLRCISASGGNPTPISGKEIVNLLKTVKSDPVLVMFDDRGRRDRGQGERAMQYVADHPDIEVLGAVAVASNTGGSGGIEADVCVTGTGKMVDHPVDKNGDVRNRSNHMVIKGDTVDVLNEVEVPVIVGVGDIGKMDKADDISRGAPITRRAIEEILKRSGIPYDGQQ
ncbi:stage V sporulation protein AE [Propionispora vibrioides]|jgi:stage V sporulation protein AE|uniref:Stage V sporulation protein AE n=1 Tax=Propionispora vibrioides TaxID=112903 RepID=A0A1H8P396_9FIRM|nr:stage V sporulation protein AE [Propionispora vibrioides]SEO36013.1 stage V sporulation protein AE [Propionispora vibrioides]